MAGAHSPSNPDFAAAVSASFARQGLMCLIGARLAEIAPGRIVIELPYAAAIGQQQGFFHGAVIGAIADSACGYASMTLLPAGREVVTVEYKINFVRPARGVRLAAVGTVERAGRSLVVARAEVLCEDAAGVSSTCALLQGTFAPVEDRGPGTPG